MQDNRPALLRTIVTDTSTYLSNCIQHLGYEKLLLAHTSLFMVTVVRNDCVNRLALHGS